MNNMYDWVDADRRNFIGGECPHKCGYCYVKSMNYPAVKARYSGKIRLFDDEFKKPLKSKSGKPIFVGSCFDMWADAVPEDWISNVLDFCLEYPENEYLFQSKNPERFKGFVRALDCRISTEEEGKGLNVILGTTIETDRNYYNQEISKGPFIDDRLEVMRYLKHGAGFKTMITIEPIIDFNVESFYYKLKKVSPDWVNIGADSKRHNLPEPSWDKVQALIAELNKFTTVKCKSSLERLRR